MTLPDLSVLVTFGGAAGVVIALVYIALQIRQNALLLHESTRILRVASMDETMRALRAYRRNVIRDPELTDLLVRGYANRSRLPAGEQLRFDFVLQDYLYTLLGTQIRCHSLEDSSHWQAAAAYLDEFFANPGAREFWRDSRHLFEAYPTFLADIDRCYRDHGGEEGLPG